MEKRQKEGFRPGFPGGTFPFGSTRASPLEKSGSKLPQSKASRFVFRDRIDNAVAQKLFIGTTGGLTGAGTLTRNASANNTLANIFQIGVANTGLTGVVILNGGVTEINTNGLGTGGVGNTITVDTGGELAASTATVENALILNGGIIGADNGTSSYGGALAANGAFRIRPGDFYNSVNGRNVILSGPLTGSAAFTLRGPGTVTTGVEPQGQGQIRLLEAKKARSVARPGRPILE